MEEKTVQIIRIHFIKSYSELYT